MCLIPSWWRSSSYHLQLKAQCFPLRQVRSTAPKRLCYVHCFFFQWTLQLLRSGLKPLYSESGICEFPADQSLQLPLTYRRHCWEKTRRWAVWSVDTPALRAPPALSLLRPTPRVHPAQTLQAISSPQCCLGFALSWQDHTIQTRTPQPSSPMPEDGAGQARPSCKTPRLCVTLKTDSLSSLLLYF